MIVNNQISRQKVLFLVVFKMAATSFSPNRKEKKSDKQFRMIDAPNETLC